MGLLVLVFFCVGLVLSVVWLVALIEVIRTPSGYPAGSQLVWVLVLLLGGPLGLILYGVLGRPHPAYRSQMRGERRGRRTTGSPSGNRPTRRPPSEWLR